MRDNMDNNLENRIKALEDWKREKESQQIKYPLDVNSIEILSKYFMRIIESITYSGGAGGNETQLYLGIQDNLEFLVSKNYLFPYTVDPTSDEITTNVNITDDTNILIFSSGTPPDPIASGGNYYVVNSTGNTFQLSATLGGSEIDITDKGSGRQFISIF